MESFSFCARGIHRSQPAGSDKRTHEGLANFRHGLLPRSLHQQLFQVRPFLFLSGVIPDTAVVSRCPCGRLDRTAALGSPRHRVADVPCRPAYRSRQPFDQCSYR
ncbi:uncharacterized protein LOC144174395 [Haemaphysalis longicornis]